jgi:hypothetical protein
MVKKTEAPELSTPLSAEDISVLEYVDPQNFYFVDLQFGAKASWRTWQGRPRTVAPDGKGGFTHTHDPKVEHKCGPFSGKIVNGLISTHNDWLAKHRRRRDSDYSGQLDRQIVVLKTEQTDSIPQTKASEGMVPVSLLERLIKSAVEEQLTALTGSN